MSLLHQKINKEFSQDMEIMTVLMFEPKLCDKHQLETIYNTSDLYDFLEIIEVKNALEFDRNKQIKEQEASKAKAKR